MNIREAHEKFATDEQCLTYIQQMRWPEGVVRCPQCGEKNVKRVERKAESKNRRKWFYLCLEKNCHNQFTPTSGTLFADTHLPLIVWFQAITLLLNAKKGISAKQLQRDLGIGGYKTAWYLNHRIREAMNQGDIPKLGGTIEIDETYVGGKKIGYGVYAGKKAKQVVIGMKQRNVDLKLFHTPNAKKDIIKPLVEKHINEEAVEAIMTDEFLVYPIVFKGTILEEKHRTIQHKERKYVVGSTHTDGIESAFSLLKRGIIGNFHQISRKHMQRYLDEFSYRFNRRADDHTFMETVCRLAGFKPLTFAALTSEKV
jgi:transposase-like protein